MANIFLNLPQELSEASAVIFDVLGASSTVRRDSANVLGGTYTVLSLLGFKIKLEQNSYDYEDQYNYMLSIQEDYLAKLEVDDELIMLMTGLIVSLLRKNTSVKLAQEKEDGLLIY